MNCFVASPNWRRRPNGKCHACFDESTRATGTGLGTPGREPIICRMCKRRLGHYGGYLPEFKKRLIKAKIITCWKAVRRKR